MKRAIHDACAGLTLLEAMIMAVIMSVLMVMITESVAGLSETRMELKTHAHVGDVADRVARAIEQDVARASRIFTAGADANAYLQSLDLRATGIAAGSRLPTATRRGYFDRDPASTAETGNLLLLGVRGRTVGVNVATASDGTLSITSGGGGSELYLVETHVMAVYHLREAASARLDLVRWQSMPMAHYWDIEQIEDPAKKAAVLTELYAAEIRFAWDPSMPRSGGLWEILPAGAMQPLPLTQKLPCSSPGGGAAVFGARHMEVAVNGDLPGVKVPEFATPGTGAFPGGFEVKVDGAAGGKLVLLRMVVRSSLQHKRPIFTEIRRLVSCDG